MQKVEQAWAGIGGGKGHHRVVIRFYAGPP